MRIAVYYFALFAMVGAALPFLPLYYRANGFSGSQMAVLGAIGPATAIVVPPLWGFAADRWRRRTRLLRAATAGAGLAFSILLAARSFWAVAAVLLVQAFFAAPITALADSIAVQEARRLGTDFSRLRLWGSVGFVVSSFGLGALLARGADGYDAVAVATALFWAAAIASLFVRETRQEEPSPAITDARGALLRPAFVLFLAAGMVHWAASCPFNLLFALTARDRGVGTGWVGLGLAIAVAAEVAVMWRFRQIRKRLSLAPLLAICFLTGTVRWLGLALATSGPWMAGLQVLHGLTFGGFYVGSMAQLERAVPSALRATGRAAFASVVFGMGGALGNAMAGVSYDWRGSGAAFAIAAGLDLVAPLLLLLSSRAEPRPTASS
jgi:PPP family 3-phenylpropionic acid transporter